MSADFHDWLFGEDSALRQFLPPTITACSPQAVAGDTDDSHGAVPPAPTSDED